MSAPSTESGSNTRSLRQSLGHSAEYAIALALLLVGVVVGAVVWFSNQAERVGVVTEIAMASDDAETEAATRAKAEEDAALAELRRELRDSLSNVEARGRMQAELAAQEQAAAEERARQLAELERRQREAEALRLQPESEQERIERLERERKVASRQSTGPAPSPAAPEIDTPPVAPAAPQGGSAVKVALSPPRQPVVTKPEVLWDSCSRPTYPRNSIRAEEEGVTVISLDIDASGRVTSGSIRESSGHRRLDDETLSALSQCRFKPAATDGVPTATTGVFRFAWNLR